MFDPRSTELDSPRLRAHEHARRDDATFASAPERGGSRSAPGLAPLDPTGLDGDGSADDALAEAFARCTETDPRLRAAVRRWVAGERDRGVLPERMLVGLTSRLRKASLTSPMATASGCEWMRATVVRWAVEDFYRDD